ncbi:Ubiquitin-conjugating enzyme E2 U [Geranomyces variabilis]|nr:Ubiquitin-conjugating enzyme E2 U [Geranomyces variabilis]
MSSRAALLLHREQYRLSKEQDIWGVQAAPAENDIFHWHATVEGLPDTPWEGGRFKLEMYFDEEYNERPPEVYFTTVPFHPNVDMYSGKPCASFLDDPAEWEPNTSIPHLLIFIQSLLANPGLLDPVNVAAAEILDSSPHLYDQLVRDCVVASRRLEAGLAPFEGESELPYPTGSEESENLEAFLPIPPEPDVVVVPQLGLQTVKTVSFDQYYDHWRSLATSVPAKPGSHAARSRLPAELLFARDAVGVKVTEEQFREMMKRQRDLWFGIFPVKKVKAEEAARRASRTARVDAMRQLYRRQSTVDASGTVTLSRNIASDGNPTAHSPDNKAGFALLSNADYGAGDAGDNEEWEMEADSLVTWTQGLDHAGVSVAG